MVCFFFFFYYLVYIIISSNLLPQNRYVKPGDKVKQFDKLCEVSSDKATVDISSRFDGVIKSLGCEAGSKMKVGNVLVEFEGEEVEKKQEEIKVEEIKKEPVIMETKRKEDKIEILATPAVRHIAKENAIDLSKIQASGKVRKKKSV